MCHYKREQPSPKKQKQTNKKKKKKREEKAESALDSCLDVVKISGITFESHQRGSSV